MKNWLEKLKVKAHHWLRWSEQYTKTDMVYLAKGGSWLTLDSIATAGITFLTALAFANFVSKDVYGTYKFVLSGATLLAIPTLQGMRVAVNRAVARGYGGSLIKALKTRLRWGLLSTLGSFGVSLYYFLNDNIELTIAFAIVALLVPLKQSLDLYLAALNGKKDFKTNTQYDIVGRLFAGAFLIAAILFSNNLYIILIAYFLPWVIGHAYLFCRTTQKLHLSDKVDETIEKYGKHLSVMQTFKTIANNLDKILLFHFLGSAPVAIYSFAIAIPEQIRGVFKSIRALAMPKFSNRSIKSIKEKMWKKVSVYMLTALPLVAIYYVAAPYIYELFFPQYMDSILPSQIYAVSLLGTAAFLPTTALKAQEQTKNLYWLNTLGPAAYILALVLLVLEFGVLGAIYAAIFRRFFNLLLSYTLLQYSSA